MIFTRIYFTITLYPRVSCVLSQSVVFSISTPSRSLLVSVSGIFCESNIIFCLIDEVTVTLSSLRDMVRQESELRVAYVTLTDDEKLEMEDYMQFEVDLEAASAYKS
jgi:hypothetical protein